MRTSGGGGGGGGGIMNRYILSSMVQSFDVYNACFLPSTVYLRSLHLPLKIS